MIGYVLLVVIAIGLSVAVFAYLKLYLPKDEPKCYDDVILSIDDLICVGGEGGNISVTLTNRGLFNINGAFIRVGEVGRIFKTLVNEEDNFLFIGDDGDALLNPGETWSRTFDYNGNGIQQVEVEPFLYLENKPVLCEKAVVSKLVDCST